MHCAYSKTPRHFKATTHQRPALSAMDSPWLTEWMSRWLRSKMQCDIAGVWIPRLLKLFTCIPSKVQQGQNKPSTHKFSQDYGNRHLSCTSCGEQNGTWVMVMLRRCCSKFSLFNAVIAYLWFIILTFLKVLFCWCGSPVILSIDCCSVCEVCAMCMWVMSECVCVCVCVYKIFL